MDKEVGGLEVRKIREFNLVLLGKWCWWIGRVFGLDCWPARYGLVGGWVQVGGWEESVWWRTIASI